jgi:hypothetical protein
VGMGNTISITPIHEITKQAVLDIAVMRGEIDLPLNQSGEPDREDPRYKAALKSFLEG